MANTTTSKNNTQKKAKRKNIKIIVIIAIILVCVILAAIFVPQIIRKNAASSASVTTYNVEAVSYGDVDTTISGSGTLTPVSSETISKAYPVTVTAVNYAAGDSVEEGAVIAEVESDKEGTEEITAPYDCIIIEQPIAVDDELEANGEIVMIMGKDGFTMGIAVDELDIGSVKIGQEVSFTIDAVDGDYTGSITAVSYNGSTSSSTTAYQITATVAYINGVYPGMSASAEIVIESSGDGLLVPVEAVRTSGNDSYLYLAPSDAEEGTEYSEKEIDVTKLTKITVETGSSDGSYIMITSSKLSKGDLIIIVKTTSTATGSANDNQQEGFGGMGGMDFSNFDFGSFDPNSMPQGGGSFPGKNN